jgi:hypothetical protein
MPVFSGKWTNSDIISKHLQDLVLNQPDISDYEMILEGIQNNPLAHQNIVDGSVTVKIQRSLDLSFKEVTLIGTTPSSIEPYLIKGMILVTLDTSFQTVYVENKDFIIDYTAGTIERASVNCSISSGTTVYVYYIPFDICVLNTDYGVNYVDGQIRRIVGSSIPDSATVFVDYSFSTSSSPTELIETSIIEAESYMSTFLIDVTSEDDILQSIATYFSLSIICNSFGIKELRYRSDNSDSLSKQWNSLATSFREKAESLFLTFKSSLPVITSQPENIETLISANVTFAITATGTNITYLWQENGVNMPGETKPILSITASAAINNNTYNCTVTNSFGSVTSNPAFIKVSIPYPEITQHPENAEANTGETVSFNVSVNPVYNGTLSYQWEENGVTIPGETNSVIDLSYDTSKDGFSYRCKCTNTLGGSLYSIYSKQAFLNISNLAPSITSHPADATIEAFKTASFSVTAKGASLTYQWYKNGAIVPGETSSVYDLIADPVDHSSSFRCLVSNSFGDVFSDSAHLYITLPYPKISYHPKDITCYENETATFAVTATGESLTYQWQVNGIDIPGAAESVYSVKAEKEIDGFCYRCLVINTVNPGPSPETYSTLSDPAFLNLTILTAKIIDHPKDFECYDKAKASFSVTAEGVNLSYLWQKNGVDMPAETNSVYQLPSADIANNGDMYRCKVTNSFGSVFSNSAILKILPNKIEFTKHPKDIECYSGETASFSINISSILRLYTPVFQWQKNGSDIPGETKESLTIVAAQSDHMSVYRCYFSCSIGNVLSDAAFLIVKDIPTSEFSAGGAVTNRFSKTGTKIRQNPTVNTSVRRH